MNKGYRRNLGGLAAGLLLFWVFLRGGGSLAAAADCKALAEAISQERTLMTKKTMAEEAMKVCPRDVEIVYQHGYTLERLRKYDEALRSYRKAISLDGGYAKAFFSIGDIQMILRDYEEAAQAYEAGLRHEPGDVRATASLQEVRDRYKIVTGKTLSASSSKPLPETPVDLKPVAKSEVKAEPTVDEGPAQVIAPILRLQVPFANSTADLSQEAQDVLGLVVGQAMRRKDMQGARFEVGGHTDNLGDSVKNQGISRQRAEVVQKYLTENFAIASERLPVAAYGHNRPLVPNSSPANQELNRRVEFSRVR